MVGENGFHIEVANALDRLICFYGNDSKGLIRIIHLSIEHMNADLAARALHALTDPNPATTGVSIGECREAEGESLASIGASWMRMLSSLYREGQQLSLAEAATLPMVIEERFQGISDRLPLMVLDYVTARRAGLAPFFSVDLRERRVRRSTGKSHEVLIDFSGSKIVANFGTLQAGRMGPSVGVLKQRLWELKVDRDRSRPFNFRRGHEMIVQAPSAHDPQITERQAANVGKALSSLEEQADQEELRLRALNTVADIGDHLLMAEAA